MEFEREERGPQHESEESKKISGGVAPRTDRERHQSAGVARGEQASRLDRGAALIEELRARETARRRVHEHRVGGKQRREHHDIAKEEYPKTVGDDDPFRSRTGFACARQRLMPDLVKSDSDTHGATPSAR